MALNHYRVLEAEYGPMSTVEAEVERLLVKINGDAGQTARFNFERLSEEMWRCGRALMCYYLP
jgi:hypothetical protein